MKLRIIALVVLAMACVTTSVVHAQSQTATPRGWSLRFFDRNGYEGNKRTVTSVMRNVGTLNREMKSVIVRGTWQLCDGPDFTGYCVNVRSSIANIKAFGFTKPIKSLRPVVPKAIVRK